MSEQIELSDITDGTPISYGVVQPGKEDINGVKFIRGGDISNGRILSNQLRTISNDVSNKYKRTLLKGNEVLISLVGNPGEVSVTTKEFIGSNIARQVGLIRPNNLFNPYFIQYYLMSPKGRNQLISFSLGSVQKVINLKDLKKVKIPKLSIDEQNKIVYILKTLDEKIQLNTQINQTLEQIAQALFKSWFVDFDPVRAKVQALSDGMSLEQAELAAMQTISGKTPEELTALSQEQPERYAELAETAKAFPCEMMEVDGVEVPKGWEVKRIDEVIQKIPVGKKYSSKTAFSEGLVPILDQGRSGVIGYHNDKPGIKASIEDPIIVFANHTCYMRLISYDFSAIQNVFAFKGKECNLYWLYLATLGKQEFVEYKGHFPDFLIKEIIAPPKELTELFGKYIKESFSKIFINDRENSILAKIRDLLLPKLLNGEI